MWILAASRISWVLVVCFTCCRVWCSQDLAALQGASALPVFLLNGVAAFGLNLSVFLLIGKTSALSMNVAGVVKDWCLIGLSVFIFGAQVGDQSPSRNTTSEA